jgi:hypothetical protein
MRTSNVVIACQSRTSSERWAPMPDQWACAGATLQWAAQVDWLLLESLLVQHQWTHTWQRTSTDAGCSNPPKAHHEFHPMGGKRPWPLSSANAHAANARASDGAKCIARHNMVALQAAVPPPSRTNFLASFVHQHSEGAAKGQRLRREPITALPATLRPPDITATYRDVGHADEVAVLPSPHPLTPWMN